MELKDIIPIMISIISLIASTISGLFVYNQTYKINKYEFMSKEKTKKDILDLLSALNLIMEKSSYQHIFGVDFEKEKEVLLNFLLSDTWMITRSIIGNKEDFINTSTKFFYIIYTNDFIGDIAKSLGEEINKIYIEHFNEVIKEKRKFKKDLGKYSKESKFFNEWYDLRKKNEINEREKYIQIIKEIKGKGIVDPDLDICLGVLTNDPNLLKNNIKRCKNINISINDVIQKYT